MQSSTNFTLSMQSSANFILRKSFGHEDGNLYSDVAETVWSFMKSEIPCTIICAHFGKYVGQKVGQTSVRYYQVYVPRVGSIFGISGAQSKVDEVPALCMNRDADSPWLSGFIVSGLLLTEICR